jgi:hypothetical protein
LVEENISEITLEVVPARYYKNFSQSLSEDSVIHVSRNGYFGNLNFEIKKYYLLIILYMRVT